MKSYGQRQEETPSQNRQAQTSQTAESYAAQEQINVSGVVFQKSRNKTGLSTFFCLLLFLGISFAQAAEVTRKKTKKIPANLLLDAKNLRDSKALGFFAQGLFLQSLPNRSGSDPTDLYFRALAEKPKSRVYLEYATAPLMRARDFQTLTEKLVPIAQANPKIITLQLMSCFALQQANRNEDALELILAAEDARRKPDPRLFREHASLLWRMQEFKQVQKLLDQARCKRVLHNHYALAFALMSFHQSAANNKNVAEKLQLSPRAVARHEKNAARYARKAVARLPSRPGKAEDKEDIAPDSGSSSDSGLYHTDINIITVILRSHREYRSIVELMDKAESLFPTDSFPFRLTKANALKKLEEKKAAAAIVAELEKDIDGNHNRALALGDFYFNAKDFDKAKDMFQKALYLNLSSVNAQLSLIQTLNALGEHREALKMLELMPKNKNPGIEMLKAQTLYSVGEFKKALNCLDAVEKSEKLNDSMKEPELLLFKAGLLAELKRMDDALTCAESALEQAPENARALNFVGYTLADLNKNLQRAEKMVLAAVTREPENVAFRDSLAWVYFRQNRMTAALTEITKTLRLMRAAGMEDKIIYEHAGDIFAANNFNVTAKFFSGIAKTMDSRK